MKSLLKAMLKSAGVSILSISLMIGIIYLLEKTYEGFRMPIVISGIFFFIFYTFSFYSERRKIPKRVWVMGRYTLNCTCNNPVVKYTLSSTGKGCKIHYICGESTKFYPEKEKTREEWLTLIKRQNIRRVK
jgi:hypothetical protein